MILVDYPAYDFKVQTLKGKDQIFDPCRKKWVVLTPEEWVRQNNTELFLKEPYWNLTLTQLFIGLSPDQARFLAKVDNEKERVQALDTMSSEIKVRLFIHQLLAIGDNDCI